MLYNLAWKQDMNNFFASISSANLDKSTLKAPIAILIGFEAEI